MTGDQSIQRAILVSLGDSFDELRQLGRAAGARIVGEVSQNRAAPDPRLFVGSGKAEDLRRDVLATGAELVIFDDPLTPTQTRNLEKVLNVQVVDRAGLILDIFARRARTREGKLQVELAQLTYLSSRLAGRGALLSRLGGGIGTRGPGETQLEVDRRRIRTRVARLRREIEQVRRHRKLHRLRRERSRVPTVSLVGYTNAGKSTLFRRLSGEAAPVSPQVFSTLDTIVRRVRLDQDVSILLSDTVGFIRKLPAELVAAFRATLEEVVESDLVIHVLDASDGDVEDKLEVVDAVLVEIGCKQPRILVFNKADCADQVSCPPEAVVVSALTGFGMAELRSRTLEALPTP